MINASVILLLLLATFFGGLATFLIKRGVDKFSLKQLLTSWYLWIGGILYAASVGLYILVLSAEQLSVVYPIIATQYIWTTFLSVRYLGEKMNHWKWSALIGIMLGVVLIGFGS